ncbi:ABC transporter permease [Rhodanobacter sp. DHB23]|uniref:ABC transporter permease n=1 Tax=Rhodanobacter sp. DHB23 TaxID=2775923 RepID=UPI0017845D58|nr:ABC transporter permease [Rhodanobacter sp. DHB23]MBD8871543.1 ABC transporter permease [Rhodanobacter sp. DHB23]
MFGYYLEIAVRSLRRSMGLTLLMVLAIGFGVGASMTAYAVFRAVSGDPIPWKSSRLFVPQIDAWGPAERGGSGEPQDALAYADAMALMRDHRAARQSAIYAVAPSVLPTDASRTPIPLDGFAVYGEFFPMLDVPFEYGSGWGSGDDARGAPVAVIGDALNRRLFGGANSVGRTVGIDGRGYRVVGVMKPWNPQPAFFDVVDTGGFGGDGPDLFLPFQAAIAAGMENAGSTNCPKGGTPAAPGFAGLQSSACTWIVYMAELDDAAAVRGYRQYLDEYAREQQRLGRFGWSPDNRLRGLRAWLDHEHIVPDDTRVSMLVALGLLLVCLLNTVGLLLTKFLRRSGEIGVRRALGASRSAVCMQFLAEAAVIGMAGGMLGLLLTGFGVLAADQVLPMDLTGLAHVDVSLLLLAVAVAVLATMLAGLYPAIRASRVQPAWQLKTQ